MKKKIFIRADGSSSLGMGHLIRCLALAEILSPSYSILFFFLEAQPYFRQALIDRNLTGYQMEDEEFFFGSLSKDILVVLDGYQFDTEYQKRIKDSGALLVCIDDLHDKEFFADSILNPSPAVKPEEYAAQSYTKFFLGLEYSLLRSEFRNQACLSPEPAPANGLCICFGGSDPENFTLKAYESVKELDFINQIDIVVGPSFYYLDELMDCTKRDNRIVIRSSLSAMELKDVFLNTAFGVFPSSTVLLEALVCDVKIVSGYYVKNQFQFHEGLKQLGLIHSIGDLKDAGFSENLQLGIKTIAAGGNPFIKSIKEIICGSEKRISEIFNQFVN